MGSDAFGNAFIVSGSPINHKPYPIETINFLTVLESSVLRLSVRAASVPLYTVYSTHILVYRRGGRWKPCNATRGEHECRLLKGARWLCASACCLFLIIMLPGSLAIGRDCIHSHLDPRCSPAELFALSAWTANYHNGNGRDCITRCGCV